MKGVDHIQKLKPVLIVIGLAVFLIACTGRQVALGERSTLAEDEAVKIRGEPLSMRLVVIGRDFTEEGEYPLAELEIKHEGKWKTISLYMGDEWNIGNYVISMESANPFGDISCELVVLKP